MFEPILTGDPAIEASVRYGILTNMQVTRADALAGAIRQPCCKAFPVTDSHTNQAEGLVCRWHSNWSEFTSHSIHSSH
jgi:hypothetical protein